MVAIEHLALRQRLKVGNDARINVQTIDIQPIEMAPGFCFSV